jgi:hypothetical protein
METTYLEEAIDCLSDERRVLHYYQDQYAIYLLQCSFGGLSEIRIDELRSSKFSKLLNRNIVKELVAKSGNGLLTKQKLDEAYSLSYESYVITLSKWSNKNDYSWSQTSRPGSNLVLQLNFTGEHDQYMGELKVNKDTFKYYDHPVHETKSSVAWARIDFDLETGEALIEEIQNDWLRKAVFHNQRAKRTILRGYRFYNLYRIKYSVEDMLTYTDSILKRYTKIWSETMLFSTIQFIKHELGINNIYYHSFETGRCLKNLRDSCPPRSLYTDLPKKFCFDKISCGPSFIMNDKFAKRRLKKVKEQSWFHLEI